MTPTPPSAESISTESIPVEPQPMASSAAALAGPPRRVLLYCAAPKADGGGVQAMVTRLADGLRAAGHDVALAWPDGDGTPRDWRLRLTADVDFSGFEALRIAGRALADLARLVQRLQAFRPDVVNLHFPRGQTLYFVALRPLLRYRLVLSLHGSDVLDPPPTMAAVLPFFLRAADRVTVVSDALRTQVAAMADLSEEQLRLVRNGIDTAFWTPPEERDAPAREEGRIVAAGRCVPVKGYDVLLRALAQLAPHYGVDAHLSLLGDGEERAALEALARTLGVADRVTFCGQCDAETVRAHYRRGSVFALSSHSEGLPLALLEAMACGLAPVATDVGGVREVVAPGTGRLVPPGDSDALAEALADLMTDAQAWQRVAGAARTRARDFALDAATARFGRVIADAAEAPPLFSPRRMADSIRSLFAVNGPVRRRLRVLPHALLRAGLPPAALGYQWIQKKPLDAASARAAAGAYTPLASPRRAQYPLPVNVPHRDALNRDAGWWGFSQWDVPTRREGATALATLPDARLVFHTDDRRDVHVGLLDRRGVALTLPQIGVRPQHAASLRRGTGRVLGDVAWICERVYHNHSHWLTAHLPKLLLLREHGLLDCLVLPERQTPVMRATLRHLGLDPAAIPTVPLGRPVRCRHLTVLKTDRFRGDLLRRVAETFAAPAGRPPEERVYVSRSRATGRRLLNEEEVIWPRLAQQGFTRVWFEDMDFDEQLALLRRTRVLIGPHGAGLTNMLFCPPGALVVEIADPGYPNPNFYALAAALGHRYALVLAESVGSGHRLYRDLHVAPGRVEAVLANHLS